MGDRAMLAGPVGEVAGVSGTQIEIVAVLHGPSAHTARAAVALGAGVTIVAGLAHSTDRTGVGGLGA